MKACPMFVLLFMLIASVSVQAQTLHQLVKRNNNLIYSKWERNSQNESCLNYYNTDFSNYTRVCEDDFTVLRPGMNTVYTKKESELESSYRYGKTYYLYRGSFPGNKFNPFFVYALPIKDGTEVNWAMDRRESKRTLQFKTEYKDTVYASRSGTVCHPGIPDSGVLIYHQDCTFAGYFNMAEMFVAPGASVMTGQPIGLAGGDGVSMTVFFLDVNLFEAGKRIVHPYSHIMPVFRTDKGDVRLEEGKTYVSVVDVELITSEMSKSERKRYIKRMSK